ncbi:MAG: cbb3-type cytochrome oxidase maturation protein [Kiritimatiellia bacterium]|jgi:cbb3-type cytochrome oxidase maturation protein
MSALILLILMSMLIALGFLGAFCWAVRSGQFDDQVTPAYRLLTDDEIDLTPVKLETTNNE